MDWKDRPGEARRQASREGRPGPGAGPAVRLRAAQPLKRAGLASTFGRPGGRKGQGGGRGAWRDRKIVKKSG